MLRLKEGAIVTEGFSVGTGDESESKFGAILDTGNTRICALLFVGVVVGGATKDVEVVVDIWGASKSTEFSESGVRGEIERFRLLPERVLRGVGLKGIRRE